MSTPAVGMVLNRILMNTSTRPWCIRIRITQIYTIGMVMAEIPGAAGKRTVAVPKALGSRLENPLRGVYATRAPVRPDSIALSRCRVRSVQDNVIEIDDIDAFPDTRVLDIKRSTLY